MGPPHPGPLNLQSLQDDLPKPPRRPFFTDLPSPRAGEIPPALSPLDAFAAQSRMLAKKFEEPREDGRRISRLPHTDVAREFASRPGFFRTISEGSQSAMSDVPELNEDVAASLPQTSKGVIAQKDADRPKSQYPVWAHAKKPSYDRSPLGMPFYNSEQYQRSQGQSQHPQDYFGVVAPRAMSPEPVDAKMINVEAPSPHVPSLTNSMDSVPSPQPRKATTGSQHSQHSQHSQRSLRSERGLAPPASPRFPKSPRSVQSVRSVRQDSGDDESSTSGFAVTSQRKFSGSSMSRPHSPFSPPMLPVQRSPSMSSEYSMNNSLPHQRPPFANFSRPISAAGLSRRSIDTRPSMDSLTNDRPSLEQEQPSATNVSMHSVESNGSARDDGGRNAHMANSPDFRSETPTASLRDGMPGNNGASSYTYAKFSLPRGRNLEWNSLEPRSSWQNHQFSWEQEQAARASGGLPGTKEQNEERFARGLVAPDRSVFDQDNRPSSSGSHKPEARPSRSTAVGTSSVRSKSAGAKVHRSTASVNTESTDRTIRATPLHQRSISSELTPQENLEIGIQAHDAGQTSKSTYHLRRAAMAGLPTAMLLYALACRHGWGMRPSQADGVMWLKKAIKSSKEELMLDLEGEPSTAPNGNGTVDRVAEAAEKKKRKAQYALAIYELGISHMNGWGCSKDRKLALECYEIAGNWGDCDALAEAGFCYAEAIGTKKDLKKASEYYRRAADLGMSMAGNSWIYKSKYMEDDKKKTSEQAKKQSGSASKDKDKEKDPADKPAGRQRSRSLWGRKKEKDKTPVLPG